MPSTVGQVWYTHLGFLLHESRSHLPTAPHAQREIHRGRLIRGTTVFIMFCDVVQLRTALVVTPGQNKTESDGGDDAKQAMIHGASPYLPQ